MYSASTVAAVAPSTLVVGGERATRRVAWWLAGGCAWVFSMVVLGGATRLTRSGLSMTDWKFQYEHPPLTDDDWAREFEKYKQSPEFKKTNLGMTVDEYKFIYWMEYGHRMWGRVLGLYFVGPLAYFASQGYITSALAKRLGVFFVLGATQGMIGWWMVKSGLEEQEFSYDCPRVSPYRLATHLTGAFTIYTGMLWTTLSVISPLSPSQSPGATKMLIDASKHLRGVVHPLAGLIGVTAISGAYVAGMDAGRAYNTFPLMGGKVIPDEYWAQWEQKGWRNFFENTAAVQFDHRVLALTTLTAVSAVWLGHRGSSALHPQSRMLLHALLATTAGQVTLGVATLLYHVPVELGSAHQANALALFSIVLALMHSLRGPKRAPRI
jgi:heme a synthase